MEDGVSEVEEVQVPAKLASTKQSRFKVEEGQRIYP
jgi:hypothetical protein